MNCAQLEMTSPQNARLVPVEPKVKSSETRKLLKRGVSGNSKTGKSADPACYDDVTVEIWTGLFDNRMENIMPAIVARIPMENGDIIRFKTTGYEIADVRNKNPDKEWTGVMIGGPSETHVVLWCERERREAAAVCVALDNIINNDTLGVPYRTR